MEDKIDMDVVRRQMAGIGTIRQKILRLVREGKTDDEIVLAIEGSRFTRKYIEDLRGQSERGVKT